MAKKLFFVYTTPAFYNDLYSPVMQSAFDGREDVKVYFSMDNGILLDTLENNVVPTASVKNRVYNILSNCERAGADCIVVGCTAVNTAVKELLPLFDVPVVSVDETMIQNIRKDGRKRVAVLSHTPINAMTIERRLKAEDPDVEVTLFPVAGAADAFAKEREKFAPLMQAAAEQIPADKFDCIALGHISAENVDFSNVKLPVYKCGESTIATVNAILNR